MRARRAFFGDPAAVAAHAALMRRVFGEPAPESLDHWHPFGLFDALGACVASVEVRRLPLDLEGTIASFGAVRRVAVDPAWRGLGLMRAVMTDALRWCDTDALATVLLFAETPSLYASLGFVPLAQHAFVGPPPKVAPRAPARRLDLCRMEDRALLLRRLATRMPISSVGGLAGAPDLVLANCSGRPDLVCLDLVDLDTLLVLDADAAETTIVDVVARTLPPMAALLGALAPVPQRVTTLFSPDRLTWRGVPQPADTGLMARGPLPAALRRPFMLPPTVEF